MLKKILLTILLTLSLASDAVGAKLRTVELKGTNTIIFAGEVNEVSVNTFMRAIIGLRNELPEKETMYVIIASQGGQYEAGKRILGFMNVVPNTQLICRYCASAAGMMFIASKNKRLVTNGSNIVMHEMYLPKVTALTALNKPVLDSLIVSSEEFNKMHYSRIGISREAYMKKIKNKLWTVVGTDALKLHLADEAVLIHCDDYVKMLAPKTCDPKKDEDGSSSDEDGHK